VSPLPTLFYIDISCHWQKGSEPKINPHPAWPPNSGRTLGCIKCSELTPDAALFCFCERTVIDNEI